MKIGSFRELRVYQRLRALHLELHVLSLGFPKFETYELGSQVRRASNAAPALVAEGWGSRHTNIYIEAVSRALGEVRETQHHVDVAKEKQYIAEDQFHRLDQAYDECGRMLEALHHALSDWAGTTRTGKTVREPSATYDATPAGAPWTEAVRITEELVG